MKTALLLAWISLEFIGLVGWLTGCSTTDVRKGLPPGGYYEESLRREEDDRLKRVIKKALEEHERNFRFGPKLKVFD